MKILHLTIKKKWFDMIASSEKKEEYREIKDYWSVRLKKDYDAVRFRNGYRADSPKITVKLIKIVAGYGYTDLGAPNDRIVYILKLGDIIK